VYVCLYVGGAASAAMHLTGRGRVDGVVNVSRALSAAAIACVTGTTSTDSLTVALGSTFGAFLALGFIVALVFLAKWQHSRRLAKQFAGLPLDDVHYHTSAATLHHHHSFGSIHSLTHSFIHSLVRFISEVRYTSSLVRLSVCRL